MKKLLDSLAQKYETPEFIKNDPIQIPHRYKEKNDIEISAFISSLFAFGKREQFIKKLDCLFSLCETPSEIVRDYKKYNLDDFLYRFVKSPDLVELLRILNKLYFIDKCSLEELFYEKKDRFKRVTDYFYSNCKIPSSTGFCFMFAKPSNNSALKRMNMFLNMIQMKR